MDIDYLSFPAMLIYLTVYYIIEKSIKKVHHKLNPSFYEQLFRDHKDLQYFVFIMGILIVLFSTPFCYTAFRDSNATNDRLGSPFQSTAGKICLASKGVLWTSELIRLDYSAGYIAHHLSSLLYLVSHLVIGFPLRQMYAFFTSLITELVSDYDCLLRLHGVTPKTSPISYTIQYIRLAMLITIRLPACIYATYYLHLLPIQSPIFWLNLAMFSSYSAFILNNIITLASRLRIFNLVGEKSKNLQLFERYQISLYSIFLGFSAFAMAVIASTLYPKSFSHKLSQAEYSRMHIQLIITGFVALIGAHNPYLYFQSQNRFNENGLWIQGAILGTTISIMLSPLIDRWHLFLSVAISLPIGEAIGRIGCQFAGCCGSSSSVPLRSAILNCLTGLSVLLSYHLNYIGFKKAAILSLAANALIRLASRPNTFAVIQLFVTGILYGFHRHSQTSPLVQLGSFAIQDEQSSYQAIIKDELDVDRMRIFWLGFLAVSSVVAGAIVQLCKRRPVGSPEPLLDQSEDIARAPTQSNK